MLPSTPAFTNIGALSFLANLKWNTEYVALSKEACKVVWPPSAILHANLTCGYMYLRLLVIMFGLGSRLKRALVSHTFVSVYMQDFGYYIRSMPKWKKTHCKTTKDDILWGTQLTAKQKDFASPCKINNFSAIEYCGGWLGSFKTLEDFETINQSNCQYLLLVSKTNWCVDWHMYRWPWVT